MVVRVSRDLDIGTPLKENDVVVQDMSILISKVNATTQELEEATEELKKVRTGIGRILGQEIEEAE